MAKKVVIEEVKEQIEIDPKGIYTFVSNGKSKHLVKDREYQITGAMALIYLKAGYGSIS